MKICTRNPDGGPGWTVHEEGQRFAVLLDGAPVSLVIAADDEQGRVWVLATDKDGMGVWDYREEQGHLNCLCGHVEILQAA